MARKAIILLDSNAYLRIADSLHPLLGESFGEQGYVLYLIPEFEREFNKSQRLKNKFGWVNQRDYIENRKHLIRRTRAQAKQIDLAYSYLDDRVVIVEAPFFDVGRLVCGDPDFGFDGVVEGDAEQGEPVLLGILMIFRIDILLEIEFAQALM